MTALQDWLSIRPDPKNLKTFLSEALKSLNLGEQVKADEPRLIRRGLERC